MAACVWYKTEWSQKKNKNTTATFRKITHTQLHFCFPQQNFLMVKSWNDKIKQAEVLSWYMHVITFTFPANFTKCYSICIQYDVRIYEKWFEKGKNVSICKQGWRITTLRTNSICSWVWYYTVICISFILVSPVAAFAKYHPCCEGGEILPTFIPKWASWKLAFCQD